MAVSQAFRSAGCSTVAHRRASAPRRACRSLAVNVRSEQVMIVNCKSGGHAFVGLYLAKQLLAKGHAVTIFNAGDSVRFQWTPLSYGWSLPSQVRSVILHRDSLWWRKSVLFTPKQSILAKYLPMIKSCAFFLYTPSTQQKQFSTRIQWQVSCQRMQTNGYEQGLEFPCKVV